MKSGRCVRIICADIYSRSLVSLWLVLVELVGMASGSSLLKAIGYRAVDVRRMILCRLALVRDFGV